MIEFPTPARFAGEFKASEADLAAFCFRWLITTGFVPRLFG